ncbi:hypothetical protein [Poriferisphaera sp. WC338]|uniref:hypothetical protein n=1 Tax=Poriferisphaera sp. WC338 TaxID=3425129 RepID=UPI003D814FAE
MRFANCFCSGETRKGKDQNLLFVPNPDFDPGFVTPFHSSQIKSYLSEYQLEKFREQKYSHYPSRLQALYLLSSEKIAYEYYGYSEDHVGDRVLKRVYTVGEYIFSTHDSSWINFLRLPHSITNETYERVSQEYWSGGRVEDCSFDSMGQSWERPSIQEVLYTGCVKFYDEE